MKDSKAKHKFHPKIEGRKNFAKMVRGWKSEIFAFSLLILLSFSQYHKLPKEEIFSYWLGVPLVGIIILYFLISSLLNWSVNFIEMRENEIKGLRRQLTCFICEASLGRIEKDDLKRLANATRPLTGIKNDNLTEDDFSLISQPYIFWGENGFEWQDETECANCGHERQKHSQDGNCPTE